MASDVMRVRLHLRQIRVLAVVVDTPEELRVRVESTVRRPRCPHCGFKCHRVHDTREREVRDLEVSGRRAALVLWVPIIRSWALTRGFALHPGTGIGTRFGTRGLNIGPHRGASTTTAEFPAPTG